MIISHGPLDTNNIMLQIDDDVVLKSESQVKLRRVILDDKSNKLNFIQHVRVACTKAARQLLWKWYCP